MKKLFILMLFLPGISYAAKHVQQGSNFVVGQCLQADAGDSASTTGSACGSGGSGIVSPGTFTWVNSFGISLSTMVTSSTMTINGPMIASGTVGNLGQVLASQGPGFPPTFIDPIVSQATYTLLNAAVRVTDAQGVILGTSTANPFYTFVTNPSTVPINVSISSGSGPSGTVLTLSGRVSPQTVGAIKNSTDTIAVFVSSFSNVTFMITPGTSTGITANFETSLDSGTNWVALICNRVSTYNTESSFVLDTTTNVWTGSVIGATNFRVRSSAWSTGIATVTIQVTGDPVSQSISVGQPTASQLQTSASINGSSNTVKVIQSTVGVVTTGIALQVVSTQTFTVQPIGITTVTFNGTAQPVTSTSTYIINTPTITFNGVAQPVTLQNGVMVDSSAYTLGASSMMPAGAVFIPVPTALTTTSTTTAAVRMGKYRSQYVTLMDDNNVILGTGTANPVLTHDTGTVTITGTINATPVGTSTVTFNGIGQPVTSTSTYIVNLVTVTFNNTAQPVNLQNGIMVDSSAFTLGTSSGTPQEGIFIPVPTALTTTSTTTAAIRIGKFRAQYFTPMDDNNVILATSTTNPFYTYTTNLTTVNFNGTSQPVNTTNTSTVTFNGIGQPVTSTSTYIINTPTITFNGVGQPVTSTYSIAEFLVSSTSLPGGTGGLSNGTTNSATIDPMGRIITGDIPWKVISSTFNTSAAAATTEVIMVSSPTAPTRTYLCGCIFDNTSATNTGFNIYVTSSVPATNAFYPIGSPANYIPAGIRHDCSHPFLAGGPGAQISIKPEVAASGVRMNCTYFQGP